MRNTLLSICFIFSYHLILFSQIQGNISFSEQDFSIHKYRGFDKLNTTENNSTSIPGHPELATYLVSYLLPENTTITEITINHTEKTELQGNFHLYPTQKHTPIGIPTTFTNPDFKIYSSSLPFPSSIIKIKSEGYAMGYHLVKLEICPFEYLPAQKKLSLFKNIDFTIQYTTTSNTKSTSITPKFINLNSKNYIQSLIINKDEITSTNDSTEQITLVKKYELRKENNLKNASLENELIPEYLIITNSLFKNHFQRLADWKTKKGVPTFITTVEEIYQTTQGSDRVEKIRNYIIYAYQRWGIQYVLLGGDYSIIPAKKHASSYTPDPLTYPTDLYYSNIDAFWDNEYRDIMIGRIPADDTAGINAYISKILAYEKLNNPLLNNTYVNNILYQDAFLDSPNESNKYTFSDIYTHSLNSIHTIQSPANSTKWLMIDNYNCQPGAFSYYTNCINGNEEFSRINTLKALNNGNTSNGYYHFIYHLDHSGASSMGTSNLMKGDFINYLDMQALSNGNYLSFLLSGGCHPANFEKKDCIGSSYILNKNGGGIAFIGNSDYGWNFECMGILNNFMKGLYKTTDGYHIGNAFNLTNGSWRLHLLGDPELPIWTKTPTDFSVLVSPSIITTGTDTVSVNVLNLPLGQKGRICLSKNEEAYAVLSISNSGIYKFILTTLSPGNLNIVVTSKDFIPFESSIPIDTSSEFVYLKDLIMDDDKNGFSFGNNDSIANAGETIELISLLKNNGLSTIPNLKAKINCPSPYIKIIKDSINIGLLNLNDSIYCMDKFILQIDKNCPEFLHNAPLSERILLNIEISNTSGYLFKKSIPLFITKDSLEIVNKKIISDTIIKNNDTIRFTLDMHNIKNGNAYSVQTNLKSYSQNIERISHANSSFSTINANQTKTSLDTFEFYTSKNYVTNQPLEFTLTSTNEYGKSNEYHFNLLDIINPTDFEPLQFRAFDHSIELRWKKLWHIKGYNVYRCNTTKNGTDSGDYIKVNRFLLTSPYLKDEDLLVATRYNYKVTAISLSGIESIYSKTIHTWTSLQTMPGWPITLHTEKERNSSLNVSDIDSDGKQEIFFSNTALECCGKIFEFDYKGNELYNIDNNVTTRAGFANMGFDSWTQPAIADINNDGLNEIIGVTGKTVSSDDKQKLFVFHTNDNNLNGIPDTLWVKDLPGMDYFRGAVISDLNNDGIAEIITKNVSTQPISVFKSNGDLQNTSNWNTNSLGYWGYAHLAVADLDNDSIREIIGSFANGLCIWKSDGTPYQWTNPIFNSGRMDCSPVIADINKDGYHDIITSGLHGNTCRIEIVNRFGTRLTGWSEKEHNLLISSNWKNPEISVGDLDGNGFLEIVVPYDDSIHIFNADGSEFISTIYVDNINTQFITAILADVDEDPQIEIVLASGDKIYGFNPDGTSVTGFPIPTTETNSFTSPVISDLDNDGKNEIAYAASKVAYLWKTPGKANLIEWPSMRSNANNTGVYKDNLVLKKATLDLSIYKSNDKSIAFYPNPSNNVITFNTNQPIYIEIIDTKGKIILTTYILSSNKPLSISHLKNGLYFIRIKNNQESQICKFIKQ